MGCRKRRLPYGARAPWHEPSNSRCCACPGTLSSWPRPAIVGLGQLSRRMLGISLHNIYRRSLFSTALKECLGPAPVLLELARISAKMIRLNYYPTFRVTLGAQVE